MSDPKDFLSRWSQRKLSPQAEKSAPEEKAQPQSFEGEPATSPAAETEFDISTLPPLESITAQSDIRVFLQAGVPSALRHAALRRVWSADPAIRDFVGLSENSWDFNAPDTLPGFGSLSADEIRKAAERFFGPLVDENADKTRPASAETARAETSAEDQEMTVASTTTKDDEVAALHQEDAGPPEIAPAAKRRHGGALPE
jgi:hypothetical protein